MGSSTSYSPPKIRKGLRIKSIWLWHIYDMGVCNFELLNSIAQIVLDVSSPPLPCATESSTSSSMVIITHISSTVTGTCDGNRKTNSEKHIRIFIFILGVGGEGCFWCLKWNEIQLMPIGWVPLHFNPTATSRTDTEHEMANVFLI